MASQQEEVNRLVATIQMLKNRDLISICQSNNLVKSGNKADLHKRIINCEPKVDCARYKDNYFMVLTHFVQSLMPPFTIRISETL